MPVPSPSDALAFSKSKCMPLSKIMSATPARPKLLGSDSVPSFQACMSDEGENVRCQLTIVGNLSGEHGEFKSSFNHAAVRFTFESLPTRGSPHVRGDGPLHQVPGCSDPERAASDSQVFTRHSWQIESC